jgi:hypothetical protein
MMRRPWACFGVLAFLLGCSKSDAPSGNAGAQAPGAAVPPAAPAPAPAPPANCGHAACGESYFIDTALQDGCTAAAKCQVAIKLVATGGFHINDQYPYRFKAADDPTVEFLGTDPAGKNVFSKPAGDWAQGDAKSGVMTVHLTPTTKGSSTISGVFKLSVCSAEKCLIEQPELHVALHAS